MKRKVWLKLGNLAYWLGWPLFWLYLHGSQRTRVLVVCDQQMLVVKGWLSDGRWSLPGGGIDKGETPEQGAVRETAEEASIKLSKADLRLLGAEKFRASGHPFNCYYFLALTKKPTKPKPQIGEIIDVQWINVGEINSKNASADVLRALELWKR